MNVVEIAFGRDHMRVAIPAGWTTTVLEPAKGAAIADPGIAIAAALATPIASPPLAELARARRDAVVVVSDKTRPVPNCVLLPPILTTLENAGIARERIEILVATGLHRPNLGDELVALVGAEIAASYRVRNHVAQALEQHTYLGRSPLGTEIWLDSGYVAADLRIVTGLIEPHLMAGYSGGRKAVVPGLAAVETIRALHGPVMLEGNIGPGIVAGNTLHDELLDIMRRARPHFMLDVTLDRQRRPTAFFGGDIEAAHAAGIAFLEPHVQVALADEADVVVTSAGGYPLDATFYQAIKGLAGALDIIRPGGTVVLAAELSEGLGGAEFTSLLSSLRSPDEFMERIQTPGFFQIDQWMIQHLCQVLRKAKVIVCTSNAALAQMSQTPFGCTTDLPDCLRTLARTMPAAQLAVIPQGPYVLATVKGRKRPLGGGRLAA